MNDQRDFDRAVDRWLDDGSDATPPQVIDAVLLAVRSTPQERDFRISWKTSPMKHLAYAVAAVSVLAVGAIALNVLGPSFGIGSGPTPTATIQQTPDASPEQSQPPNPCDVGDFGDLPVGETCWAEPNARAAREADTSPVRILYTIPATGWSAFLGPYKDVGEGEDLQRVNVTFADVQNLTVDACIDQVALDPAVGPTVDDLAAALAELPPFEVASPPADVTAFGYRGKHLEIMVPESVTWEVIAGTPLFTDCYQGVLRTWIDPALPFAFYGYTAPGDTEEFWILDVEGARIVIAALRSANASAEMLAEQQAVLDSIVIQP